MNCFKPSRSTGSTGLCSMKVDERSSSMSSMCPYSTTFFSKRAAPFFRMAAQMTLKNPIQLIPERKCAVTVEWWPTRTLAEFGTTSGLASFNRSRLAAFLKITANPTPVAGNDRPLDLHF
jgi:hypothetical protein